MPLPLPVPGVSKPAEPYGWARWTASLPSPGVYRSGGTPALALSVRRGPETEHASSISSMVLGVGYAASKDDLGVGRGCRVGSVGSTNESPLNLFYNASERHVPLLELHVFSAKLQALLYICGLGPRPDEMTSFFSSGVF